MKILGLIPARGGSKAVPDKNIRPMAGKSLVQRAWETALEADVCDKVVVSTDSSIIAAHAESFGADVPFLRPAQFAGDNAPMIDVALHALEQLGAFDAILLLQPPSPFRTAQQLKEAVTLLKRDEQATAICSVAPVPLDQCPHYLMRIEAGTLDYFLPEARKITRRQDVTRAYFRDGAVFLARVETLRNNRNFYGERCLPLVTDWESAINIDDPRDWDLAEARLKQIESIRPLAGHPEIDRT
ncbi:MAG TPA: acylneuraminate cytidylyltransferase family protein [Abditibacteriaceae bacterium]|jgi:CMP-N-acetylneuraminic acid synthetase